mgnify:CR=1 FL=1
MKEKIIAILSDLRPEFDFTDESLNFIEEGMLDSFDIVTLISDFEDQFGIQIAGSEVLPENFANIDSIVKLLERSK